LEDPSDANLYWFDTSRTDGRPWSFFFYFGASMMCWLNYPFAVWMGLPFWAGSLIYSIIGLIGILQFYKLVKLILGNSFVVMGYNLLPLIAFMPNMHFWTAGITKETLCFLAISTILLELKRKNFRSLALISSCVLLTAVRPHVAFMLLSGIGIAYLIKIPLSRKRKFIYSLILIIGLIFLYSVVSMMLTIDPWDIASWLRSNQNWRDSFIGSNSYVPIQDYNYFYKAFTFYFRPLFFDAYHLNSFILSIENLILATVSIVTFYHLFKKWRDIEWSLLFMGVIIFNLVGVVIYVERYAGLGIFARTRMMFLPFLVIFMLYIINHKKVPISNT
jgi:hypothetical protein